MKNPSNLDQNQILKVGQTWRRRDGETVSIVAYDENPGYTSYPFDSSAGDSYTKTGNFWLDGRESEFDLVELISDAPILEPHPEESTTKPTVREGQIWRRRDGVLVAIMSRTNDPTYPFVSSNHGTYTPDGRYNVDRESPFDLLTIAS